MQVNNDRNVPNQLDFTTIRPPSDNNKVTLKAEINGKNYSFTVIKAGVGKLSDAELKSQYGEKFAKMAKVAEVVDLKAGEILAETKDKLSLKGRMNEEGVKEERKTYNEGGKISIKLPSSLKDQVQTIRQIYQGKINQAGNGQVENPVAEHARPIVENKEVNLSFELVEDNQLEIPQVEQKKVEDTANKVEKTKVFFGSTYKKLTAGAAKVVWIPEDGGAALKSGLKGKVIYTPVTDGILNSIFKLKENEIRGEAVLQTKMVNKSLEKLGYAEPKFLAVDMKIEESDDGTLIASAAKALGDLEKLSMKKELTPLQAAKLALGPVKGMNELHKLGYALGDVKSENTLGYVAEPADGVGDTLVKLSDFGKTVKIKPDETKFYSGNMSYAPPERELSQKGDVFGLGMITLRTMEERILAKTGATTLEKLFKENKTGLRGVDHFRKTHKSFATSRVEFLFPTTKSNMTKQERDMKWYVSQFEFQFRESFRDDPMSDHIQDYVDLLKDTFKSDPLDRPTAEVFEQRYEAFLNAVENDGKNQI